MDGLPRAAMLLSFDIAAEAQLEHDDWHSHEHLPERLAIPGFLRGSRWRALAGGPAYFVMYEVGELGVLSSPAYMDRLNHPSPWTAKMMPSYRGMRRGLCEIVARAGHGLGGFGLLLRFGVEADGQAALRDWLAGEVMPALPAQDGAGERHAVPIRPAGRTHGRTAHPWPGCRRRLGAAGDRLRTLEHRGAGNRSAAPSELERRGASGVESATYQLVHCLSDRDLASV